MYTRKYPDQNLTTIKSFDKISKVSEFLLKTSVRCIVLIYEDVFSNGHMIVQEMAL